MLEGPSLGIETESIPLEVKAPWAPAWSQGVTFGLGDRAVGEGGPTLWIIREYV